MLFNKNKEDLKMDEKGQGALEYLLLIGGAVLVAVIVIVLLVSLSGSMGNAANNTTEKAINYIENAADTHIP